MWGRRTDSRVTARSPVGELLLIEALGHVRMPFAGARAKSPRSVGRALIFAYPVAVANPANLRRPHPGV